MGRGVSSPEGLRIKLRPYKRLLTYFLSSSSPSQEGLGSVLGLRPARKTLAMNLL
jgi:hypothetical protein